jgi:predicted Zn-dependent protease
MVKSVFRWLVACWLVLVCAGCSTVPIVGRNRMTLVPEATLIAQSQLSYGEVLTNGTVVVGTPEAQMVKRVGNRIAAAVEQYFSDQGMSDQLAGYDWQFVLLEEDVANAWCMPGGKVAFYTGILPFTKTEAGLAVVMGHEIAHAVARHGNERISAQLAQQGLGAFLSWGTKESEYHEAYMMAYGLGSQYAVMLPYSRLHEREADRLGLIFMAMAGYDPEEAVAFWQRMSEGKGKGPMEFMSTHPSDESRIANLEQLVPEAMKYYQAP